MEMGCNMNEIYNYTIIINENELNEENLIKILELKQILVSIHAKTIYADSFIGFILQLQSTLETDNGRLALIEYFKANYIGHDTWETPS